jgi:hypothetical protein
MKRLIVFGPSTVNPCYVNSRVLHTNTPDDYYFGNILSKVTGITDLQTFSLNGPGNEWISSAVINQLDQIDKDTLVIVYWSSVDRYDLVLGKEQDHYQEIISKSLEEQYLYLGFNETFDASGNKKNSGLRYWTTAQYHFDPKIKLKSFYSHLVMLKHYYEKISLIQNLLDRKGCQHIHINGVNPAYNTFTTLIKSLIKEWSIENQEPLYKLINFEKEFPNIEQEDPEIIKWQQIVNKDRIAENMFDFFVRHNVPYACTNKFITYHQPPINNYLYIKKAIVDKFDLPTVDTGMLEEIKIATENHCKKYNAMYNWNGSHIDGVLND